MNRVLKPLYSDAIPFDPAGGQALALAGMYNWQGTGADPSDVLASLATPGAVTPGALASSIKAASRSPRPIDPATALVREATWAASLRDIQIAASPFPANSPGFNRGVPAMMAAIDAGNAAVANKNAATAEANAAIYGALRQTTKQSLPDDPEAWKRWWFNSLRYSYQSRDVGQAHAPRPVVMYTIASCFAAGTTVRTMTGGRPIEALRVGDRVLSQDTATGALACRPITRVLHNPPAQVLRVRLGEEEILATGFHRFWKVGQGWAMARELKAGDVLRTLGGLASVESVEPDRVQPVFNLDVADDADFFVGKAGALVHDNTLPDPRAMPFDAPKPVAVARSGD